MPPARIVFWAATLGGIVLSIRSIAAAPPSLAVAIACALAYGLLIVAGVMFIRLRMFADAVLRGERGVALTFDDGPDPQTTNKVLEILAARDAKATFFVIGAKAEKHPDVIRAIVAAGHEVGVHGFVHDRLFSF